MVALIWHEYFSPRQMRACEGCVTSCHRTFDLCCFSFLFSLYLVEYLIHTAVMKNGKDLYDLIRRSCDLTFLGYSVKWNDQNNVYGTQAKRKIRGEGTIYIHICAKLNIGNKPLNNEISYLQAVSAWKLNKDWGIVEDYFKKRDMALEYNLWSWIGPGPHTFFSKRTLLP